MKIEMYVAYDKSGEYEVGDTEVGAVEAFVEENNVDAALHVVKLELEIGEAVITIMAANIPANATSEVVRLKVQAA